VQKEVDREVKAAVAAAEGAADGAGAGKVGAPVAAAPEKAAKGAPAAGQGASGAEPAAAAAAPTAQAAQQAAQQPAKVAAPPWDAPLAEARAFAGVSGGVVSGDAEGARDMAASAAALRDAVRATEMRDYDRLENRVVGPGLMDARRAPVAVAPRARQALATGWRSEQLATLQGRVARLARAEETALGSLPGLKGEERTAKAGLAAATQSLSIARDRAALAQRALDDATFAAPPPGRAGAAAEARVARDRAALARSGAAERVVAAEVLRERARLAGIEAAAARGPALAEELSAARGALRQAQEARRDRELVSEARNIEQSRDFAG
jgi:hypothetical protein